MVDVLCKQMKNVSFAPNVESLCTSMKQMEVHEPTFKENRVQYLINCMKRMPKIPQHVHKALAEERKVLERRIKRERRKYTSQVTRKPARQAPEPETDEPKETETESEEFTEVFEESYMENDEENHFDIDNFNDE